MSIKKTFFQPIKMTYHWDYVRYQLNPFNDQVVKCSGRSFLNRVETLANALQKGGILRLDCQVVLLLIKERDDMLTSPLSNYAARISTYKNWPPSVPVTAETLTRASFFMRVWVIELHATPVENLSSHGNLQTIPGMSIKSIPQNVLILLGPQPRTMMS